MGATTGNISFCTRSWAMKFRCPVAIQVVPWHSKYHDEILRNHYKKSRFNGATLTTDMEWNVVGHSCFCKCYEKPGV